MTIIHWAYHMKEEHSKIFRAYFHRWVMSLSLFIVQKSNVFVSANGYLRPAISFIL